jgi:acyl carrier protein
MTNIERVNRIIVARLGAKPEDLKPEANFVDDLGADSLDGVELVMAIEEEFNAEISDDDLETIKTLGDLYAVVDRVTAGRAS